MDTLKQSKKPMEEKMHEIIQKAFQKMDKTYLNTRLFRAMGGGFLL